MERLEIGRLNPLCHFRSERLKRTIGRYRPSHRPQLAPKDHPVSVPTRAVARILQILLYAIKNPITSLTSLGALLIVIAFLYDMLTPGVFIEDVDIQGTLNGKGFTGSTLLSTAIDEMHERVLIRVNAINNNNRRFLELVDIPQEGFKTSHTCLTSASVLHINDDLFISGLRRALMSSTTFDTVIVTSKYIFSIRRFAFFVRRLIGWDAHQITPIFYQEDDHYVFKMLTSPSIGLPHIKTFKDLSTAELVLSDLLVDYFSPALAALEKIQSGNRNLDIIRFMGAAAFLNDHQGFLLSLAIGSGYFLENSIFIADQPRRYTALAPLNRYLLANIQFSLYGDFGSLLKLILSQRLALTHYYELDASKREHPNMTVLYDTYIRPYNAELSRFLSGEMLITILDVDYGEVTEFRKDLAKVLSHDLERETNGLWTNISFVGFSMALLMTKGDFEEANRLAGSEWLKGFRPNPSIDKTTMVMLAFRAALNAYYGKYNELIELANYDQYPCVRYAAIGTIIGKLNDEARLALRDVITNSFEKFETQGISDFHFYNGWGIQEASYGRYDSAMTQYEKALQYPGDHEWALLNWGSAAFRKGDFSLARQKYSQSLALISVPQAVFGLLTTLEKQNDLKEYLKIYSQYKDLLRTQNYDARRTFELDAIMFACQMRDWWPPPNILEQGENLTVNGEVYDQSALNDLRICSNQ
jgi:hypothetical protein